MIHIFEMLKDNYMFWLLRTDVIRLYIRESKKAVFTNVIYLKLYSI
jgi:hypothetical protein